jgi:hypothetical protein
MSYLLVMDGKLIASMRDLIYGNGGVFDFDSLQDFIPAAMRSCEKIGDIPNFPTCSAESDGSTSG